MISNFFIFYWSIVVLVLSAEQSDSVVHIYVLISILFFSNSFPICLLQSIE